MTATNKDVFKWMQENKDSLVKHINSLNYQELKNMHIECEKRIGFEKSSDTSGSTPFFKNSDYEKNLKDFYCELKYLTHSLDFCKQNVSSEQYNLLNDFANIQYYYKHRNPNPNEKMDSSYWAELLDKNNISWSLQNLVSDITDKYENKSKYLSTLFKAHGININTLENREKELLDFYTKEAGDLSLDALVESFEKSVPEIRFAIKQYNYDAPSQINEIKNTYEEANRLLQEKYIKNEPQSVLSYSAFEIVTIDKNDNELDLKANEENVSKKTLNKNR